MNNTSPDKCRYTVGTILTGTSLRLSAIGDQKASPRSSNYVHTFTCIRRVNGAECGETLRMTINSARNTRMCAYCRARMGAQTRRGARDTQANALTPSEERKLEAVMAQRVRTFARLGIEMTAYDVKTILDDTREMLINGRQDNYADVRDILEPVISRETYGTTALGLAMRGKPIT